MTYRVTQQDIDAGLRMEPSYCPVARAIRRRHVTKRIAVWTWRVRIGDRRPRLPKRVTEWMVKFDRGESVNPIRFEL